MASRNYIPPETIDEIRSNNDIVEVIIECGVPLKQAGRNYKGLCPFHQEKTPSFSVSQEMQVFKCFGCDTGGNVIHFLQKHEGKTFVEAIEWLAERANIPLSTKNPKITAYHKRIRDLRELNRFAVKYYHELLRTGPYSQQAREYLKNRGILSETINFFNLGYAKQQRKDLVKAATHQGWTIQQLVDAGLIKNEDYGPQDRFWNRILFPIYNVQGFPVGFGGRSLSNEHQPKYLNSPGTILYNKSRILFNLDKARQSITGKQSALLVEGYMDVLMLHQNGIENVLASSGTSLSEEHTSLLKRYTPEVVIVFDGDASGLQAAQRGLQRLIAEDIRVRIAILPKGDDPDSFVKENGVDAFNEMIDKAINLIEFHIQSAIQTQNIRQPDVKIKVIKDICKILVNIRNHIERAEYIKYAVHELDLDEGLLWRELRNLGLKDNTPKPKINHWKKGSKKLSQRELIEEQFVQALVQTPELIREIKTQFDYRDLTNTLFMEVSKLLWDASNEVEYVDVLEILNKCEEKNIKNFITKALIKKNHRINPQKRIMACLKMLNRHFNDDLKRVLQSDIDNIAKSIWSISNDGITVDIQHLLNTCDDENIRSILSFVLKDEQFKQNQQINIEGFLKELKCYLFQYFE